MNPSELFLHLLALLHGLTASLLWFLLLWLAGVVVLPTRWYPTLGRGGHPAVFGAALFVLVAWYGIQIETPLPLISAVFACAMVALALLRRRSLAGVFGDWRRASTARWIALFAALYVLAYALTLPPVTGRDLPIAWSGNIDLLIYLDYTNYLRRLGPPQPPDLYLAARDFVYFGTPALYHLLGGYSVLFGADAIRAAMPAQFALTALTGLVVAFIARRVFAASPLVALVAAAATISGPFFRCVVANYFLSTLLAMPVMLHFLLVTVRRARQRRPFDWQLALSSAAHALLLLFLYPFLFLAAFMFQAALVVFSAVGQLQDARGDGSHVTPGQVVGGASQTTASLVAGVAAVIALAPAQAYRSVMLVLDFSRPGLYGWPLDVISPLALLGVPGSLGGIDVSPGSRSWALAGIFLIGAGLLASFFWWFRRATTVEQRAIAGCSALGFFAYAAYFSMVGPSYQQWKMASYVALPLSFVVLAGLLRLAGACLASSLAEHPAAARRLVAVTPALVGLALVGGNLVLHANRDPRLRRLGAEWRNLARIDELSSFRDVSIAAPDRVTGMLAAYYLPRKRLHILGPEFYPPISFDGASRARPLLIPDYGCEGIGHEETLTVEGVGCLLFAPPSLAAETTYSFGRSFLFVSVAGLDGREDWGRWNRAPMVKITLAVDRRRVRLDRDAAYLNVSLRPGATAGEATGRMRLEWGVGRRAETGIDAPTWISLPLQESDWTGEWLASQVVSLELPDVAGTAGATRSGPAPPVLGFVELSVSREPRGVVVPPGR